MRISTNTLFETGSNRIGELQSSLARAQEQMTAGRRILVPSDDPVAAAQALELTQSQSINSQFATNRKAATSALNMEEHVLQSVTGLIQDVQALVVGAGNGTLDDTQRKYLATELRGRFDDLLGQANTRDGAGNFLFAGYRVSDQPFAQIAGGARYDGDQGQRTLQVGPMRKIETNDPGSVVFEGGRTGNGTFTTAASFKNDGTGIISTGSVVDKSLLNDHRYAVDFTVAAGVTTYSVYDLTQDPNRTGAPLTTGPYTSGESITFNGMQFSISGNPADGDSFSVEPSERESLFKTVSFLINILETPATGAAGQAKLRNGLNTVQNNLDKALDNVLTVRAAVGSRLKELESLDAQGEGRDTLYAQSLSELQDLDYVKAITDLSKQKIMLEAAQQAYVQTSRLSLFNYM
ncbi:flagellar hook-associated protein FlgL [Noviherbaspirillum agri]